MSGTPRSLSARRVVSYATCIWCVAFGAPHFWWALVGPAGFPGGPTSYDFMMSSAWRVVYLWVVNTCAVMGFLVPLALLKPADQVPRRWIPHAAAWIAFGLLTLRGVGGFIADRGRDLIWDPTFTVGGSLCGAVAWFARRPQNQSVPTPTGTSQ